MTTTFAFLDTNIFLHFQPFDQIRWAKELHCERVILILPQIVVHELDRMKDEHASDRIRNRARTILSRLHDIIEAGGMVDSRVELRFEATPPTVAYADLGLDSSRNDDRIIASVYTYKILHPGERLVIVTNDTGLRLKCRIHNIESVRLRDDLYIKNEADPERQRLKELEAENAILRKTSPQLSVGFRTGGDQILFTLQPELAASVEGAQAWLAAEVVPRVQQPSLPASFAKLKGQASDPDVTNWSQVFAMLAIAWNEQQLHSIDKFYSECISYHLAWTEHQNLERRTCRLALSVDNFGSTVGEDVYVFFTIPTYVQVFADGRIPAAPKPPQPTGVKFTQIPTPHQRVSETMVQRPVTAKLISNVITGSHRELCYHIPRVQHHVGEWLPLIAIRFYTHLAASSIVIPYRITASNAPAPVIGQLTIEVSSPQRTRVGLLADGAECT